MHRKTEGILLFNVVLMNVAIDLFEYKTRVEILARIK